MGLRSKGRSTTFSSGLHLIDWNHFDSRQLAPFSCRGADEPDWASVSRNCMCGVRTPFALNANQLRCRKTCEKPAADCARLLSKPLRVWKRMGSRWMGPRSEAVFEATKRSAPHDSVSERPSRTCVICRENVNRYVQAKSDGEWIQQSASMG